MRVPPKNLYAILGVAPDVDAEQLRVAHQTALRLNSDLSDGPDRQARLAAIDDAYTLLSNPVRRQVYDASLAAGESALIDRKWQSTPAPAATRGAHPAGLPDHDGLLSRLDPERVKLWRRIITLSLVLCLPLFYFLRQADFLRKQGEIIRAVEEADGASSPAAAFVAGRNRAEDFKAFHRARERLVQIEEQLQELGPDGPDRSGPDRLQIQALSDEKQRMQSIITEVARTYGRP